MIVVTPAGGTIDLGAVEVAPTIGITDYSRRVTDDFGVTTVVPRGFSRRMSVRLALPSEQVDGLQQTLADLRATAVSWVADDRFRSLTVFGFYKDFSIDIANGAISYCTLTIEGLAETADAIISDIDPAPDGQVSSLLLVQPIVIDDATLVASNVDEDDAPAWSASATHATGATVIRQHRVYESQVDGNVNVDPITDASKWLDTGPTNRWRMFDQALGSVTTRPDPVSVTLHSDKITAIALLDVVAATVRVAVGSYDVTLPVVDGTVVFQDVPASGNDIVVAASGPGTVSIGTLLAGTLVTLGVTEASPSAGITDYSRKDTDDFGNVTVVPRAWAKRMSTRALIRTDAIDDVASRIAAVRAQPSLWIGQSGRNSLTVYGFFKDFSIEVGQTVSKLSLSIEGLSKATPISPIIGQPGRDGLDGKDGRDGRDGIDGTNGLPGEDGADGRTTYVHYAYANSADGTLNFAVGAPEGRTFVGTYTDFTPGDSTNPAAYRWSRYAGPATFGLASTGAIVIAQNRADKIGTGAGAWDAQAFSTEGWRSGALASFRGTNPFGSMAAGLNSDPATNASFTSLDYGWFVTGGGVGVNDCRPILNGVGLDDRPGGAWDQNTTFQVIYDNRRVRWLKDGWEVFSVDAPADLMLYFDSSIFEPGVGIKDIGFTSAGRAGTDGRDGTDGTNGLNGMNGQSIHIAYADSADGRTNFTTGAAAGRAYIGVYTDTNPSADSPDPAAYGWTLIRGADGARGLAGPGGYVHIAYADSADGTVNFHLSDPTGRRYIGTYTDQTEPDSTSPAAYAWQLVKGADGTDGVDGKDGVSPIASPPAFVVPSFSNGSSKPAWAGGSCRITLIKGGQEIAADSYSYAAVSNISSIAMSGQNITFADVIGDKGEFTARATRGGVDYDLRVTVIRAKDGSAAFRSQADFSGQGSASVYANTTVPQGRLVRISGGATYYAPRPGTGQTTTGIAILALYWRNMTDGGPLNFLGEVQGSTARSVDRSNIPGESDIDASAGQVAASFNFTSPAPDKQLEYSAQLRSSGASVTDIFGNVALEIAQ